MAPGAKFSTMISARFAISLTSARPRSDFRLMVTDFLLALNSRKYQESWPSFDAPCSSERPASPPCGFSTLTTSAPSQASASVQEGPASNWVRSRTRTPARQSEGAPLTAIYTFLPVEPRSLYGEFALVPLAVSVSVRPARLKRQSHQPSHRDLHFPQA